MPRLFIAFLAALAIAGTVALALADHRAPDSPGAPTASLGWMSGTWVQDADGQYIEETWSEPKGGEMLGMFRWSSGGKLIVYEILVIKDTDDGPELCMRHFGKGLRPWETDPDGALRYSLMESGDRRAVFLKPASEKNPSTVRLAYERTGDRLTATIRTTENGDSSDLVIRFTRKP